jgi:hypothetical protein
MATIDDPRHDREAGSRSSTLDTTRIDDVRIGAVRPLITPALLQERVPVKSDTLALVEDSRAAIAAILKREGIEILTGYPVNHLIEFAAAVDIRPIIVRQERIGLHMADAISRSFLII